MSQTTLLSLFENHLKDLLQEDRSQYILQNQGKDIEAVATQDKPGMTAQQAMDELKKADPTPNKQYIQWIVNTYLAKQFRLEDVNRLKGDLDIFHKVKNKLEVKDINQYKSLNDFYDAVEPFTSGEQDTASKGEIDRAKKLEGAKKIIQGNGIQIIKLLNKEAACLYGKGTKWCTAADGDNMYDHYAGQGDIIVIMADQGGKPRKFQYHFESDQFMDERDQSLSKSDIAFLSGFPEYKAFLEAEIIRRYFGGDLKEALEVLPKNEHEDAKKAHALMKTYV